MGFEKKDKQKKNDSIRIHQNTIENKLHFSVWEFLIEFLRSVFVIAFQVQQVFKKTGGGRPQTRY